MSESTQSHTPGPWKLDDQPGCRPIKGGKSGKHKQAQYTEVAWTVGLWDDDEDRANARLIAAAPEMYDLLASMKEHGMPNPERIEAVLAKARGQHE